MAQVGRFVKQAMIDELSEKLADRSNVIVTSVNRLPASDAALLRRRLRELKASVVVVKQTLGRRAMAPLKLAGIEALLDGTVALVVAGGPDVLPAARAVVQFIKEHEEQLAVRGGLLDGEVVDGQQVTELASLPSRPQLLAQVVLTLESPTADLIVTVERLLGDLAWVVEQASQQKPVERPAQPAGEAAGAAGSARPADQAAPPSSEPSGPPAPPGTTPGEQPSSPAQPQEGA